MLKNDDVIKYECGLPKTFSYQNVPKLIGSHKISKRFD